MSLLDSILETAQPFLDFLEEYWYYIPIGFVCILLYLLLKNLGIV